ncbi:hypothetical protein BCR41DRAFT_302032 [Lobosporangium transversale]|uniref:GATA-type domain-containing protein n=1 Tax=Lobosporangium transversale TaxID=64571 RepID=A0A1Y2GWS8_9FUNG|nr:hypothetical protein BCR41DRAFT_302032 [Lobosporangium transversale]ORZ23884.1 hypothetical protein BCR41DRAFT_302032 [Lobosporangium transversale]|eukprot:XP_021883698.1 hypothetical protein BCR41DRAFT_302032 [Lobosporangium transversale]
MVGHALAPSSPSFQRTVNNPDSRLSQTRQKTSGLSAPAEVYGSSKDKDGKLRKLPPSPRHPALDAAIRKKSSSASSSSPPTSYQEADTAESGTRSGHGNSHVLRVQQEEKSCESCGTTNSPEWRRGQSGKKDLCNACGLRYSRSVARQNRQAQKQLEGKGPKAKVVKSGKAAKSSPKKGVSAEPSSIGSVMDDTMLHPNTNFMQDSAQHSQQNQQIQHTQASQLTHAYPSEPGIGSIYSLAVKPSFYHGQ